MHILSIEDDLDTQTNLCDILELDGYLVDAASTLKEALDRQSWLEYTAIILDRKLPDGSADELLPHLRDMAPQAAIIIVTGHTDLNGTIAALRNGAADYILKPINPDALRLSLARISKLRAAEQRALQAERLAAIGQMVSVLTHESRTFLQRIQASVEMLELELEDHPETLTEVARIQKANDGLRELLEEVRSYAAPLNLDLFSCSVSAIWRQAWSNLEPAWRGRDAVLHEETNGVDLNHLIDVFRFEQVFRNLFENSLGAASDPARIEIRCTEIRTGKSPALQIILRDNGPGLTKEQQQKVFDAFYTTKAKGTGLGMAIVKRIVEAHGGQIVVGEEYRNGAEFRITLPRIISSIPD